MKKTVLIVIAMSLTVFAASTASFMGVFTSNYKVAKGSNLGKANCLVCHASAKGGKLNPYGKDIHAAMKKADSKKLTATILKSVEGIDSDKDGTKNGDAIKADKLPGG